MAFKDDDRYDDDLTQDDGFGGFDDDEDEKDDDAPSSSRDRAKSQINPYSRPSGSESSSGQRGSPFRSEDVRREFGGGSQSGSGSRPSGSGSGSGSGSSYGSGGSGSGSRYSSPSGSGQQNPRSTGTFGTVGGSGSGPRPSGSGSSSPFSSGSGGSSQGGGSRPGGSSSYGSGSSGLSDRISGGQSQQRSPDRDRERDRKPDPKADKKDEGGIGSRLGGVFGRGDADKKDDKRPSSSPVRKDDKKGDGEGSGVFGGLASRAQGLFKRGGDEKPKGARDSRPGTSTGTYKTSSPFSSGGKSSSGAPRKGAAEEKTGIAAITGKLGGLFNRNKDAAAKPDARSTGSTPVVGRGQQSSAPVSPRASAASQVGASSATRQAARGQAEAEPRGGIWEGLMGRLRGGQQRAVDTGPQSRTKREASTRVPELDTSGWSLDTKLDLIGIGLMVSAIVMVLSAASGDQGQLMGPINRFVGQVFGWGALAVPMVMFSIGAFLLVTRFGDTPPVIDVVRLVGAMSGYLALLTLFQFIVLMDPIFEGSLETLKANVEQFTWSIGRGGGVIGTNLHLFLIENIGEIGGFGVLVFWLIVSAMLLTRTSATQLIVVAVSLFRSFRVSWQHRQQRAAAERALNVQKRAEAQARLTISRPDVPELKPGTAGALPAGEMRQQPLPIGDQPIPIRLGGQLISAEAQQVEQPTAIGGRMGAVGGLLKRLPGRGGNGTAERSDPETETAPTGGLRGFISRRSGTTPSTASAEAAAMPSATPKPATPLSAPPPPTALPAAQGNGSTQQPTSPYPASEQPTASYAQPPTVPAPSTPPAYVPPVSQPPAAQTTAPVEPLVNPRTTAPYEPPVAPNREIQLPKAPSIETNRPKKQYALPDFRQLLAGGAKGDYDRKALVERARIIQETLESFGAPGKVVEINTGPVITQFGVEPGYVTQRDRQSRVKVSAIAQLDKDLQLALGARSIRIEAPVPGKGYVGIEVPNDTPMTVSLRDVMESNRFQRIRSPLALALGEAVDGTPVAADLAVMPHLLIAGTTGSGKSVMVNAIISSLLLRNTPEQLRFIMVDPKRVELTGYNGIPHLVAPVVVDVERIIGVLKWVTREMDDRYKKFSIAGARNIDDYNRNRAPGVDIMPFILVVIDELADLMMLAPEEAERYITRIAAMARATGIHLVISTQRPSADVVTGLIKANFPVRIAFAVASGVDSRVIIDQPGAEKLLGRGDMLFMSGDSPAPQRLQGVFVSDQEIQSIHRYWKSQGDDGQKGPVLTFVAERDEDTMHKPVSGTPGGNTRGMATSAPVRPMRGLFDEDEDDDNVEDIDDSNDDRPDDELYARAVDLVRRQNGASVSLLQRKMRIGYARAARLIDAMEERGIVGPAKEGSSKQRDVLPQ